MSNVLPIGGVQPGPSFSSRSDLLDSFLEYLIGEGLAAKTRRTYVRLLDRILDITGERGWSLDDMGPIQVAELAEQFRPSRSSKMQLRSALRHYWLWTDRYRPPIKAVRIPAKSKPVTKALTIEDAATLARAAEGWHPQGTAVMFGLYLALRAGEIARARFDSFDTELEWYRVENIKGGAVSELPVHPKLREQIRLAMMVEGALHGDLPSVFPGQRGRTHITEQTVWNWVREVSEKSGIGAIHPHVLRHTALAHANDALGDLRAVSEFARHAQLETTRRYTRTTVNALRRVSDSLDY